MKRIKALLPEEELLVTKESDKVRKVSKRASETREQTLHRQEQNQTHLACARVLHFSAVHLIFDFSSGPLLYSDFVCTHIQKHLKTELN